MANEQQLASLAAGLLRSTQMRSVAAASLADVSLANPGSAGGWQPVYNPADTRDQVGWVRPALAALMASPAGRATLSAEACLASQPSLQALQRLSAALQTPELAQLGCWQGSADIALGLAACQAYLTSSVLGQVFVLPGPTGETNRYQLLSRGTVWALPQTALGLIHQVAAALASGSACWIETPASGSAVAQVVFALPPEVQKFIQQRSAEQLHSALHLSALLFEGDADTLQALGPLVAQRSGAIVRIESLTPVQLAVGANYDLSALMHEQSISTNTAAAGGNAQLMTMA